MNIITPDCDYTINIKEYKNSIESLVPGCRVIIARTNPAAIAESLIGNWELNLVSIPVDYENTPKSTFDFIVGDCSPHAILYDDEIVFYPKDRNLSDKNDHAIFYTSGTTGNPKGVVQTRDGMKSNAMIVSNLHGFNENSVHLTALPLYHCNAAAMSLFGNYFRGGTAVFLKKFTPESYMHHIEEYGATTANLVPTMVNDLAESDVAWPQQLKYVLTAATALSQEVCKKFYKRFGAKLRQGYGLSEGVNFSFTMPLLNNDDFFLEMVLNYPPVGVLVQGEFRIQDEEVQLRGENIMRCYWNNEEATKAAFTEDGWFKTGDRGEMRNGYLVLTGRFKEIIIKGGDNYSPVMIEDTFRRSGVVGDLAVVGCKDERLGEDIALVCEKFQPIEIDNKRLQPASVRYGKVERTQTKKPQRNKMSKGLVSLSVPDSGYRETLAAAGRIAQRIVKFGAITDQQRYLSGVAEKLLPYAGSGDSYVSVKPYFSAIEHNLDEWWNHKLDKHIFSGLPWKSLMNDTPMGGFPKLTHQFCKENNLYDGKVLEIGAGVGNFSRYVPEGTNYLRTDIDTSFLTGKYGREMRLNIDETYPLLGGYDLIVGVNVMHCARNKVVAINHAYETLNDGGVLLLGEGQNPSEVWALDLLFGFIDGWWDRGGFIHRNEWLNIFENLSHQEIGYSVYREGKYDLGGIVWLRK